MATTPNSIPVRRKLAVLFTAAALNVAFAGPLMAATPKAGQTCKKAKQKSGKLTCTKTSKGLRWVAAKKATTKAPDTKAPDSKAPDTKAPGATKAPDTKAPDTKAPGTTKAPDTKAP